jgi:hypothetical protein
MEAACVNLLESMMDECVMMDKTTVTSPMGGFNTVWVEGAEFKAFVRKESAPEIRVAEQDGANEMFTVVVPMEISLEYHDVFKRLKDGKIFRVTSDGDDKYTPQSATLDMRQVTAEEYTIGGGNNG